MKVKFIQKLIIGLGCLAVLSSNGQKANVAFELTDMNFLYKRIENPISIAGNVRFDSITVDGGCKISKTNDPNKYIILCDTEKNKTQLNIYSKGEIIYQSRYRVNGIPDPKIYFGMKQDNESINILELPFINGLRALCINCAFDFNWEILSFQIKRVTTAGGIVTKKVTGNYLNATMKEWLLESKPYDVLHFDSIEIKGPDNIVKYNKGIKINFSPIYYHDKNELEKKEVPHFAHNFEYNVQIINFRSLIENLGSAPSIEQMREGVPYKEHILFNKRTAFLENVFRNAGNEDKPVYSVDGVKLTKMNRKGLVDEICEEIQLSIPSSAPPYDEYDTTFRVCKDLSISIKRLNFNEVWSFGRNGEISKNVNYFEPISTIEEFQTGDIKGEKSICRFMGGWSDYSKTPITNLIRYRVFVNRNSLENPDSILSNNSFLRNKTARWLKNTQEAALKGKIKLYSLEDIEQPLGKEDLKRIFHEPLNFSFWNELTDEVIDTTTYSLSRFFGLVAFDFFESWTFTAKGNFKKELLAYVALVEEYDPYMQEFMGLSPVFLRYNDKKAKKKLMDLNFNSGIKALN